MRGDAKVSRAITACAALFAAALGGCGWNAQVAPPAVVTPQAFPGAESQDAALSLADVPWWRYFDDPTLISLIRTGLANDQNLAVATARVEQAAALVSEAQALALPQVHAGLTTTPEPATGGGLSSVFFGGVTVTWQVDFWGRYHAAAQSAREAFFASKSDRDAAVESLVASIASTWFQLKSVEQQIRVSENNADDAEHSRRITEHRTRQGVSSAVELHQAETQLYTVRDQIPALRATAVQLQDALDVMIGKNPGEAVARDITGVSDITTYPEPPVGLPSALLRRRPDVVAAEERLRAAGYNIAAARAALLPSIGLTAAGGRTSSDLGQLVNSSRSAPIRSVGPTVDQPIFEGGELLAEIRRTKGARAEAEADYRNAILSALQNVDDALSAYRQAGLRMQEAVRLETAAHETERIAAERFAAGVTSFLEVLDSQRELYSAQLELSLAEQYRNQAAVDLYRSLGGGWSQAETASSG